MSFSLSQGPQAPPPPQPGQPSQPPPELMGPLIASTIPPPPSVPQPPVSHSTHAPEMPVPTDVLNNLASSVHLSSIQSLVDLLLELPLPRETCLPSQNQPLITPHQEQQHLSNNIEQELVQQHHLSHQLSSSLRQARQQLQELSLNWINVPVNEGNIEFSRHQQLNSYLLSLLQQKDIFGDDVRLPPVIHKQPANTVNNAPSQPLEQQPLQNSQQFMVPSPLSTSQPTPTGPQTRSHSSQPYWNPFINEQQQSTILSPSPASTGFNNQQQQPFNRHLNQIYSNENSNSNSSFPEIDSAAPGTPSTPSFHPSTKCKPQAYNDLSGKQPPGSVLSNTDINSVSSSYSPSSSVDTFSSLGERVKKRQRNCMSMTPVKVPSSPNVQNDIKPSPEDLPSPPAPKKTSKPSSSSSSMKASNLSSHHRLLSSRSSAPPLEQFEAMLDDLFDLDPGKKKTSNENEESDSDSEAEVRRKPKKTTNGDADSLKKTQLLDIAISPRDLIDFVCLSAKLKRTSTMQNIPVNKLGKLLTVLSQQLTIQTAGLMNRRRKSTEADAYEDNEEEESIANSTTLMSRFETCCDCCLLALYIMTSKGMSSRVYMEECIEQIVGFLNTTIQQYTTIGGAPSMFASPKKGGKSPKKHNNSVSPFSGANKKLLSKMYVKWSELIHNLVELLNMRSGTLTDTLVLSTTRVALGAFFLESLTSSGSTQSSNEIQLNALKLTSAIFAQYQAHRALLIEEILHSIARVSTCKRSRVLYKVEGDDKSGTSISMFSALLLRLIQSLFVREKKKVDKNDKDDNGIDGKEKDKKTPEKSKDTRLEQSQTLRKQYESALQIALFFLSTFLKKCCGISGGASSSDSDFKLIFENLVNDLMVTLYKPEWPAAQFLTKVLITIFLNNLKLTNKSERGKGKSSSSSGSETSNTNMKLISLEHLGVICARYARELSLVDKTKVDVQTRLRNLLMGDDLPMTRTSSRRTIDDSDVEKKDPSSDLSNGEKTDDEELSSKRSSNKFKKKSKAKKLSKKKDDNLLNDEKLSKEMWKHLLRYCDEEKLRDEKNLYSACWLKDLDREMDLQIKEEEEGDKEAIKESYNNEARKFMVIYRTASNTNPSEEEYHVIDSKTAEQIIRYIDISTAYTSRLFDFSLLHIINTLSATSLTNIRSRAMKALSTILNNAPKEKATSLLSRPDLQRAIRASLLDTSTSVRDSTIDLIGKYILNSQSEELIDNYYDILAERILDTGVSVRKKVIKILREICLTYPSYKRVPEICSKIIRRINDDGDGVRKLVTETFTSMWFKEEHEKDAIHMKVKCINHVVATVITERIGTEWLHQLLTNLFNVGQDGKAKVDDEEDNKNSTSTHQLQQVITASSQIIDVLVSDVLCGSGPSPDDNSNKSICFATMTTIWLFSKVCPQLLVNHISILQPYLTVKITSELDSLILVRAVQTIEHVLPKLTNPSDLLITNLEESLTKNILQSNPQVLVVCVSCLSSLIHKHTNNKQLAQEIFKKFFTLLDSLVNLVKSSPAQIQMHRPRLLRALYTCGLFAKHFDFLEDKQQLYNLFVRFVTMNMPSNENEYRIGDLDVILKALHGLGFMFERNPSFTLELRTKSIYKEILGAAMGVAENNELRAYQEKTMAAVLENLTHYLSGELNAEITQTFDWSKENLKTMSSEDTEEGDPNSIQSSIIQTYLSDILKCALCPLVSVRRSAVNLINIIHKGGIVHPLQLVPYLIAMSSDDDLGIRTRADHVLHEIERKFHGFVSMKSRQGVLLSFQLHSDSGRRGYRIENVIQSTNANASASHTNAQTAPEDQIITGRLATLYSVISSNRQSRRAFIDKLLSFLDTAQDISRLFPYDPMSAASIEFFDRQDIGQILAPLQQYISDNIIWLPYSVLDEPLYILSQLEVSISVSGSQIQAMFKDILNFQDDYEDEDEEGNPKYTNHDSQLSAPSSTISTPLKSQSSSQITPNGDRTNDDSELMNLSQTSLNNSFSQSMNEHSQVNNMSDPIQQHLVDNYMNMSETRSLCKGFISAGAVVELTKSLREFYMLCWCKQMIRELYGITDAKCKDYSPNENQKVWDKQMHRRVVDVRILDKLMRYPKVKIDPNEIPDEQAIRAEFRRFKNLQITGLDNTCKNIADMTS